MSATQEAFATLLAQYSPPLRELAVEARALVRDVVPDAQEEVDGKDRLVGFTFLPGTYRGLFAALALQKSYVNLIFSKGVELMALDPEGLLEGTGKAARHVKNRSEDDLRRPALRKLLEAAAARTPRA